jgi:hypothetical protein
MYDRDYVDRCVILYMQIGPAPTLYQWNIAISDRVWVRDVFYPSRDRMQWGELKPPPLDEYEAIIKKVKRDQETSARSG